MAFVEFLGLRWPDDATRLLAVTVADVLAFRDTIVADDMAPKTVNRRIASLSSFYKYLQGDASELRLPITVPNPAHAQFIARGVTDPRDERWRCRRPGPAADGIARRRYPPRLPGPGDLEVLPLQRGQDGDRLSAQGLRLPPGRRRGDRYAPREGRQHRGIGLHFAAAQAIVAYVEKAKLTKGPLFRARPIGGARASRAPISAVSMYKLLQGYLARLPGSTQEEEVTAEDGTQKIKSCVYTPHSLRATTATLLLDAGVDIIKVKELLGHRHVTTTQIYDKRRRSTRRGLHTTCQSDGGPLPPATR